MNRINLLKPSLNLSSTNKLILESIKKFSRSELKEALNKNYSNRDIYKMYGQMGLLGPTIKDYGCLGSSYKMYGLIAKEIEYIDSGFRSMFSVQSSLVMNPLNKYGNQDIKDKYLEKLAKGEYIGCFGLTEPDSGSDAGSMIKAELSNNEYIINGSKTWITNSLLPMFY